MSLEEPRNQSVQGPCFTFKEVEAQRGLALSSRSQHPWRHLKVESRSQPWEGWEENDQSLSMFFDASLTASHLMLRWKRYHFSLPSWIHKEAKGTISSLDSHSKGHSRALPFLTPTAGYFLSHQRALWARALPGIVAAQVWILFGQWCCFKGSIFSLF